MFNAPRNGITFNDPFAGGDLVTGNLAFSAMRETKDGGTYNRCVRPAERFAYHCGFTLRCFLTYTFVDAAGTANPF